MAIRLDHIPIKIILGTSISRTFATRKASNIISTILMIQKNAKNIEMYKTKNELKRAMGSAVLSPWINKCMAVIQMAGTTPISSN